MAEENTTQGSEPSFYPPKPGEGFYGPLGKGYFGDFNDQDKAAIASSSFKMAKFAYDMTFGSDDKSPKAEFPGPSGYKVKVKYTNLIRSPGKELKKYLKTVAYQHAFGQAEKFFERDYRSLQNIPSDQTLAQYHLGLSNKKKELKSKLELASKERRNFISDEELKQRDLLQNQLREINNQTRKAAQIRLQVLNSPNPVKILSAEDLQEISQRVNLTGLSPDKIRQSLVNAQNQRVAQLSQRAASLKSSPEFNFLESKFAGARGYFAEVKNIKSELKAVNDQINLIKTGAKTPSTFYKWFAPRVQGQQLFGEKVGLLGGRYWQLTSFIDDPFGYTFKRYIWGNSDLPVFLQKAGVKQGLGLKRINGWFQSKFITPFIKDIYAERAARAAAKLAGRQAQAAASRAGVSATSRLGTLLGRIFTRAGTATQWVVTNFGKKIVVPLARMGASWLGSQASRVLVRGASRARGAAAGGRFISGGRAAGGVVRGVAGRAAAQGLTALAGANPVTGLVLLIIVAALVLVVLLFLLFPMLLGLFEDNKIHASEGVLICADGMSEDGVKQALSGKPMVTRTVEKKVFDSDGNPVIDPKTGNQKIEEVQEDDPALLQKYSTLLVELAHDTSTKQYAVNPALVLAIGLQETGLSSVDLFNISSKLHKPAPSSYEDAFRQEFKILSDEFFAHNQQAIVTIAQGEGGDFYYVRDASHAYAPYDGKTYSNKANKLWLPHDQKNNLTTGVINTFRRLNDSVRCGSPADDIGGGTGVTSVGPDSPSGWPTSGTISRGPTSDHGEAYVSRVSSCSPLIRGGCLTSVDIAAPVGTPVYATMAGDVIRTLDFPNLPPSQGNYIFGFCLPAGNGLGAMVYNSGTHIKTDYWHFDPGRYHVKVGDKVQKGTLLGYVGLTGCISGPHTHYSIMIDSNGSTKADGKPVGANFSSFVNGVGVYSGSVVAGNGSEWGPGRAPAPTVTTTVPGITP